MTCTLLFLQEKEREVQEEGNVYHVAGLPCDVHAALPLPLLIMRGFNKLDRRAPLLVRN